MSILKMDGCSLYYEVKGEGTPIMFIHPPLLTSTNFVYQIEQLSKQYKVITFDIRGHGQSSYSTQEITYLLIVNDMVKLLNHLRIEKAFICGYSTGGTVLLQFLLTQHNRALGGIIISGMSEVNDFLLKLRISIAIKLANKKTISLLRFAISKGNSNSSHLFKKLYRDASNGDVRNIEQYYRYSLHYNCTNRLQDIDCLLLLIYGKKNKTFHRYARLLHEKLPHNILTFLEHEKHQIPTKAAPLLHDKIIEYISQH